MNKPTGVLKSPSFLFTVRPFFPIEHLKLKSSNLSVSLFFNIIILFLEIMTNIKIILYECLDIYKILDELSESLKFTIELAANEKELESLIQSSEAYLIVSKRKQKNFDNQIILDDLPKKINKIIEIINLRILKENFSIKSNVQVGKYLLNLNSREIFLKNEKIKLTEQEVKILFYLKEAKTEMKVEKLQLDIWGYNPDMDTHTVETHIHRLRKKMKDQFNDKNFIISSKNGYLIN